MSPRRVAKPASAPRGRGRPERWSAREVTLVGEVVRDLDPRRPIAGIDLALTHIVQRTGADAGEIFAADPWGRELFLVSLAGGGKRAFCEQVRFARQEGLPGRILERGSWIGTADLAHEPGFLRESVKRLGYRTFIGVPIVTTDGVGGTLDLAWKRAQPDLRAVARVLELLARPLGLALASGVRGVVRVGAAGADVTWQDIAQAFCTATESAAVTIARTNAGNTGFNLVASVGGPLPSTACPNLGERMTVSCPALVDRRPAVIGAGYAFPVVCADCGTAGNRYCVPLVLEPDVRAIAVCWLPEPWRGPLTRQLPSALALADACARMRVPGAALSGPAPAGFARGLTIRCLGTFEVVLDGRQISRFDFARKKALELLALLTLHRGRPVSRLSLSEWLWPDCDPDDAANRFHVTVNALRHVLEPGAARGHWRHLKSNGDSYMLDPDSGIEVDFWRFQELLHHARRAEAERRPLPDTAELLEQAVSLVRGLPFAEFADTPWCGGNVLRWQDEVLGAFARLGRLQRALGERVKSLEVLRGAIRIDPLCEELVVELIRQLMEQGQFREAMREYEALAMNLDRELAVEPQPETQLLYEKSRAAAGG